MTVNADYIAAGAGAGLWCTVLVCLWSGAMAGPRGKNNSINNHRKNLQIIISSHIQKSRAIHIQPRYFSYNERGLLTRERARTSKNSSSSCPANLNNIVQSSCLINFQVKSKQLVSSIDKSSRLEGQNFFFESYSYARNSCTVPPSENVPGRLSRQPGCTNRPHIPLLSLCRSPPSVSVFILY